MFLKFTDGFSLMSNEALLVKRPTEEAGPTRKHRVGGRDVNKVHSLVSEDHAQ